MSYSGKQATGGSGALSTAGAPQPGWLLNVQRGVSGTTPVPHQRGATVILVAATATATPTDTPTPITCTGDCDESGGVTINEIISMVNIALGTAQLSTCPLGDADESGAIEINEIVAAVSDALNGCP
jgi:hypothetical protein